MSIALPYGLPAAETLRAEGIEVRRPEEARRWGRRPLRICLVNLMPTKAETETQFARLLGGTSSPVELTLMLPDGYRPRHTPERHLARFYRRWSAVRAERFDGLVVTGAPVELLPFESVSYWAR